ncbi:MmyB family transcriptional regulator [Streptomyces uncialis]|uniref:MmyB family transcriptional regulator n=1 Tax=Streptomyces uncialis TaxID=1048205 RepID=UPI0033F937F8
MARDTVAALRRAHGLERHAPRTTALIDGLLAGSEDFAALWSDQDVTGLGSEVQDVPPPDSGAVDPRPPDLRRPGRARQTRGRERGRHVPSPG